MGNTVLSTEVPRELSAELEILRSHQKVLNESRNIPFEPEEARHYLMECQRALIAAIEQLLTERRTTELKSENTE